MAMPPRIAHLVWLLPLLALPLLLNSDLASPLRAQWAAHGAWPMLPAAVLLLASHGLRAGRLQLEWGPRLGVGLAECLRVSLLHTAAVNLVPMRGGEAGFPLLLHRRWGVTLAEGTAALLWLRVQDLVAMAWLAALTLAALVAPRGAAAALGALLLAALATLGFLFAASRRHAPVRPARPSAEAGLPTRLGHAWRQALAATTPASWGFTLGNWLCKLGGLGLLFAAWSGTPALAGWCAAIGGELAAVLPIQAPGGFGSYEAAMAAGARVLAPLDWLPLLTAALAVHLFGLAVSLLAALWALRPVGKPAAVEPTR